MNSIFALMDKRPFWRDMEGGTISINNPISNVRVHGVDSAIPVISVALFRTDQFRTDRVGWMMI